MPFTMTTTSEEATRALGAALGACAREQDVILLSGDLGAGKTALVKGLAEGLDVLGTVTSPTFNILLVHPGRIPLYHIDLYRLETPDQLDDIDYFGTIEADGVTAVEWGDRFTRAAPPDHLDIRIAITGDTTRTITVTPVGPRSDALAEAWIGACRAIDGVGVSR